MTTDAIGVRVVERARRNLGALPLPAACGERVGVRGTRIRRAQSTPHPISLVAAASGPLPAGGERAPQAPAPPARTPDEPARAAYFPLTRVTRIFQKSVLTKFARAHERRRAGVPNATSKRRRRSPGEFHYFRIVIYNGWRNACVCRPSWPGE